MQIKRISTIIASLTLAVSIVGCVSDQTSYQDHNYSTRVDQDSVSFVSTETTSQTYINGDAIIIKDKTPKKTYENVMTIYKLDGRVILLWDKEGSDLYVDSVNVRVPLVPTAPQKKTNWLASGADSTDNELAQSEAPNCGYTEKSYSRRNALDGKVMEEAQKSFNDLYKKLEEKKVNEGIDLLK